MEKTPFRKDVSDGKRYPKAELRRFVVKEGKLLSDPEQRLPGRGYYLSKGSDPVKAEKAFRRILRRELSEEEKDGLRA